MNNAHNKRTSKLNLELIESPGPHPTVRTKQGHARNSKFHALNFISMRIWLGGNLNVGGC